MPPAARLTDSTAHGTPLNPGTGSPQCIIGMLPAWRAVPMAAAAGIQAMKQASDATIQALEQATIAAPDPTSKSAALSAEIAGKTAAMSAFASAVGGLPCDKHMCLMPAPAAPPPVCHGMGVVLQASTSVMIDNLPATRQGDKVVEALGGPDPIVAGEMTVVIG